MTINFSATVLLHFHYKSPRLSMGSKSQGPSRIKIIPPKTFLNTAQLNRTIYQRQQLASKKRQNLLLRIILHSLKDSAMIVSIITAQVCIVIFIILYRRNYNTNTIK